MRLVRSIFFIIPLLLYFSCSNPFNPIMRKGEVDSHFQYTPDTPDNVLKNLMLAYNQKSIEIYKNCISEDFVFHVVSQHAPEIGQDWWGYEQELEFHRNLFSAGSSDGSQMPPVSIFLNLEIPPSSMWTVETNQAQENWVTIAAPFYLHLNFGTRSDLSATGYARFHLKPVDGRWYIAIWVDESLI